LILETALATTLELLPLTVSRGPLSRDNFVFSRYSETPQAHSTMDCDFLFDSMHRHHQSTIRRSAQLETDHGNDGGAELL